MLIPHRSVRAGLGLPTSNYGGAEPRGDMDVMLSMRAQGLISSRNRGLSLNSGSGSNSNGTSNPNSSPQSLSQMKTQTPSSSASPKLPMATLKGFFTGPSRPRTPSLVGSNGGAKSDEPLPSQPSTPHSPHHHHHHPHNLSHPPPATSAGTHILNRLRGNSEARPLSPLGYTPSVASISTATNSNAAGNSAHPISGGVDPPLSSGELERKILLDQTDTSTSGASGSNWTLTQRKQSLISQQSTGVSGLVNPVSAPLQPPPWRKQSTGPSSVAQPQSQSQVDLPDPDPTTYQYLHTNMSAIESFGVHNTHPPSRHSTGGTRPSLDISPSRDSQGSGSVSGVGAGGSFKGSLGVPSVGEKKMRPPSWTSTLSTTESTGTGPKRWSRQGVLPKRLTPPSGALPSIPVSGAEEETTTPRLGSPHPYSFDRDRSPSRSSSYSTPNSLTNSFSNSNQNSPHNGLSTASFLKRQSGSSFLSVTSTSNVSSQLHTRGSTGSGTGTSIVGSYISRSALSIQNRLSLAPPQRPVPNTALPPTPAEQGSQDSSPQLSSAGLPSPTSSSVKSSFRDSLTQRAMRLSLAGIPQKTPPTTNLPLRPDDPSFFEGHRRSHSSGNISVGGTSRPTTLYTIPGSPSPAEDDPNIIPPALIEKEKQQNTLNLSLRQRLRMLSAPASTAVFNNPTTSSSDSSVSTRLLAADQAILMSCAEGEGDYGSVHTRLLVGEPITTMQNDPSFLLMATPTMSPPAPPARLFDRPTSPPSSLFTTSNPSSPSPTQSQFPSSSTFPPPQYPIHHTQRSPQLTPLPVPPRSPFRQLPKPPSPAPSYNSRRSHPLPPSPPPTQQLAPEITSLSPPPWTATRRLSVVPTMLPKDDSASAGQRDERPPPTFMDSPPLLAPQTTPPIPFTPRISSADSITNLSI